MAIQAKIEFYVRISDARHPELFEWIREAGRATGMSPQDIAIYCMREQSRRGGIGAAVPSPLRPQPPAAPPASPGPNATPVRPVEEARAPAPAPASDTPVPLAPFGGGLVGGLMDRE